MTGFVGRMIALNRLGQRKGVYAVMAGTDVKKRILEVIARMPDMPQRTRDAAKLWLKRHRESKKAA